MGLVLYQSQGLIPPTYVKGANSARVRIPARSVGAVTKAAALQAGFRKIHFEAGENGQFVGARSSDLKYIRVGETTLLVVWAPLNEQEALVEWVAFRQQPPLEGVPDPSGMSLFVKNLEHQLGRWQPPPMPPLENPLVAPGQRIPSRYTGQIWDYSPLATINQLGEYRRGILPLGYWAFGWGDNAEYDAELYLPVNRGVPVEELGVLVCAPPDSGKTYLSVRWAAAAYRAGRSVFLIDVKGNLRGDLEDAMRRVGVSAEILHFTTAAWASSDRINFLAGISPADTTCTAQLDLVATSLLPRDNFKNDSTYVYGNTIRITKGFMKLLKLMAWYAPQMYVEPGGTRREVDLTDLLELVESEEYVMQCIDWIREQESLPPATGMPNPSFSVKECVSALAIALGSWYPGLQISPDGQETERRFRGGARSPQQTYNEYALPLINALDAFRVNGPLGPRIRSFGEGGEIRISDFANPERPVVILLSACSADGSTAPAVLGTVVRRLRFELDDRRREKDRSIGEVLLLLDETSRIPGFDAVDFTAVMRDCHVGFVLVYQELSMISKDPDDISKVMKNVGAQIYLDGYKPGTIF